MNMSRPSKKLTPAVLKKKFEQRGLYFDSSALRILSAVLNQRRGVKAVLIRGPPGVGKTALTRALSDILNASYHFFQCTLGTSEDELLWRLVPSEETKSGIKLVHGPLPIALLSSRKQKTILCLDEFDKTRPSADALLLDYLQNARVSLRDDGRKELITGKSENLIVFLTSNDEREFSEPLLRRVIQLKLSYLQPELVKKILAENNVEENLQILLVQLYIDTIAAGLRKPATIQELLQLAEAIKTLEDEADFTSLVRAFVIKDEDDWRVYTSYISQRQPYRWIEQSEEQQDIASAYEAEEVEVEIEKTEQNEQKPKMPSKIPILHWKFSERTVEKEQSKTEEVEDVLEEHSVVPTSEKTYDAAIKILKPEPSDLPTFMEGLEVRREWMKLSPLGYGQYVDTAKEPKHLAAMLVPGAQIFFKIPVNGFVPKQLIEKAREHDLRILWYSNKLVRLQKIDYDSYDYKTYWKMDIAITPSALEIVFKVENDFNYKTDVAKALTKIITALLSCQLILASIETKISKLKEKLQDIASKYEKAGNEEKKQIKEQYTKQYEKAKNEILSLIKTTKLPYDFKLKLPYLYFYYNSAELRWKSWELFS